MKRKYSIVAVHCVDQSYYSGVYDPRVKEFEVVKMITVGHLIREDDEVVILASEYYSDHDVRYVSVIPKVTIKKMEVLREQKTD